MNRDRKKPEPSKFVSCAEVAAIFGCSRGTVRRWSEEGNGFPRPYRISGRVFRWLRADIEAFIARAAPDTQEAA